MKSIKIITSLLITISPLLLLGQTIEEVWNTVSNNNLTIKAYQQQKEAECMENHVGLAPDNTEVEFAYLWGNPNSIGNRIDVSVMQPFEFPTTYVYRNRIARLRDEQSAYFLNQQQNEVLKEVGELYYNIVYQNARISDMNHCLQFLSDISSAYKAKFDAGEINIFDYNRVKLAELNLQQEKSHAETERNNLLLQLQQLNGGVKLEVTEDEFPEFALYNSFNDWQLKNPKMEWLNKQQEISQQEVKLSKSMWAPKFQAGYMCERVPSELFQGIKVGLTLPLWQQTNTVKLATAQSSAAALLAADEQFRFRTHLQCCYETTRALVQQIDEYRSLIQSVDVLDLLNQALESGQISLIEYLSELSLYHESHERLCEMEHDAAMQYVELQLYSR